LKKIIFFLLGNLIPQVILASLFLWLATVLDKDDFANLTLLDSIFQGLLVVLLFGMDKAVERFSFIENSSGYAEELLATASIASLAFGIVLSLIYFCLTIFFNIALPLGLSVTWIYILLVSVMITAVFQLLISYTYVKSNVVLFASLRAGRAAVFAIIMLIFVGLNSSVILGKLLADLLASLILVYSFLYFSKNINILIIFQIKIFKNIFSYSAPFVLALIASFSLNHTDRFFIASYIDLGSVANYALSQKVVGMVTLVVSSISLIVPPFFYKSIKTDSEGVYRIISEVMDLCFWLCFLASCALPMFIYFIYDNKYLEAPGYIPLLLLGVYLSIAVSCSTALCLLLDGRSFLNMGTGILAALISVGLNLIFLPLIGVYGAIFAYTAAMCILYVLQYFIVKSKFKNLPFYIPRFIILCLILSLLSFFVTSYLVNNKATLYFLTAMTIVSLVIITIKLKNAKYLYA